MLLINSLYFRILFSHHTVLRATHQNTDRTHTKICFSKWYQINIVNKSKHFSNPDFQVVFNKLPLSKVSSKLNLCPPPFPVSVVTGRHRVNRMLGFFSSRPNWDSPTPSPAGECVLSPLVQGGKHRLREGGSHLRRGYRHCGTLGIYVICTGRLQLCPVPGLRSLKGQ